MQPFQWFNRALRFDFEMRLGDGPGWLQFGPAVYYGKRYQEYEEPPYYYDGNDYYYKDRYYVSFREPFSRVRGGGLDVNYKHFIDPKRSTYFAAGLSYTYFEIDYWGYGWDNYIEDGLQYHAYVLDNRTQNINRLGINTYFGYQIPTRYNFLFDFFGGLAYRHSFSNKNKPAFNDNMLSFGHTGFVLLTGFRIGFGLR